MKVEKQSTPLLEEDQDAPYYAENWETLIEHVGNNVGSICYIVGSVFFLPQYYDDYKLAAAVLFIIGSVLLTIAFSSVYYATMKHEADFLPGAGQHPAVTHDQPQDIQGEADSVKTMLRVAVVTCALLIIGCCFFIPGESSAEWTFALGVGIFAIACILFGIVGYFQTIIVLKSWRNHEFSDTLGAALLFISLSYLIGAFVFLGGCVLFLFPDTYVIAVWIFILGSAFFQVAALIKPYLHIRRLCRKS